MANLGDSRAVACIHGAARQLTQVHHVDDEGDGGGDFDGCGGDNDIDMVLHGPLHRSILMIVMMVVMVMMVIMMVIMGQCIHGAAR